MEMANDYPTPNTKAFKRIKSFPDAELFENLAEGISLCSKNARQLFEDSHCLFTAERPRGGQRLEVMAYEEASKQ